MHIPTSSPRRLVPRRVLCVLTCGLVFTLAGCGGSTSKTNVILGGNITGLTDSGLTLTNGISNIVIGGGTTTFTFPSRVAIGASYVVEPTTLPANQVCTVTNGSGVANGTDVNTILVTCVPSHTLGGTITGLTTNGLVLVNGSNTVGPLAGAQSFTFPNKVGQGFAYGVTVLTQPLPRTCAVVNGAGTMGVADVNGIQVNCS